MMKLPSKQPSSPSPLVERGVGGEVRKRNWSCFSLLLLVILLLTACDSLIPPEPTPTREIDDSPTLAPSPTFLPLAEGENPDDFIGRSNPTTAALAAEGEPDSTEEPPIMALPTEATIPMSISTSDGVLLSAQYYGAPVRPAPVVLLVHGEDANVADLSLIAQGLQQNGYNVMLLSLRGYRPSNGQIDWSKAGSDVSAALENILKLSDIRQVAVIGQGAGAAAGLLACGQTCRAFVALNPVTQASLPAYDQLAAGTGQLPILILADANTQAIAEQINQHAPGMRAVQPYFDPGTAVQQTVQWLQTHLN